MTFRRFFTMAVAVGALVMILPTSLPAHDDDGKGLDDSAPPGIGGSGPFEIGGPVEFMAQMTISELGGGSSNLLNNDIWGWTDSQSGREFALVGRMDRTAFVDVTNPEDPWLVGVLPSHLDRSSVWRDIKTYNNYAYIVADGQSHGLQIFDLTALLDVQRPPSGSTAYTTFDNNPATNPDLFHHNSFTTAHNIAINEESGYAYILGSVNNQGNRGLYALSLANPTNPTYAGGYWADGYTHDAQIVTYHGTDSAYVGKEIAFAANEDTLTVVDIQNKSSPTMLARKTYSGVKYAHQGWLSEDHQFYFMDDEQDEWLGVAATTRTHIWDVRDLNNPTYLGYYSAAVTSSDHNLYTHNGLIYAADYTSGLRVLDPTLNPATGTPLLTEVGYLDTYPTNDSVGFNGAWSVYPYFESGTIVVNDRQNGLFIARMLFGDTNFDGDVDVSDILTGMSNFTGPDAPLAGMRFEHGSFDGDGDVDVGDLLTSFSHFTGPGLQAATAPGEGSLPADDPPIVLAAGSLIDRPDHANLLYDPTTGNVKIDPSEGPGGELLGYVLQSGGDFNEESFLFPLGGVGTGIDTELSEASLTSATTIVDLGNVFPSGLDLSSLEQFLTRADYNGELGSPTAELDLVVVPEPSAIALAGAALLLAGIWLRRRRLRG